MKLLLRLAVLFACASGVAAAKSFELVNLRQDVYFLGDGSVRVVDSRTYDFNGSFSFAQTTIEPRDGGSVRFEGATATDGKPAPASSVQGNTLRLDFSARDEQRSFQFAYTLRGDLDVANDVVQFDRQLLTSRNPAVSNYTVVLHAPAPNPQPFRVFVFTGNSRVGTLTFNDRAGTATMNLSRVSEDEFVRVRAFLPTAQFPTAANTIAKDAFGGWLEEIARDTQGFRDASRAALERGGFAPPPPPPPAWLLFLPFVSVIFIGANIVLAYQRYGREPVTEEVGRYYREPAEDIPPSMVPYVMTQTSPGKSAIGRAVGATLLDFARRGHVKLERTRTSGFFGIGAQDVTSFAIATPPDRAQVTPFEAQLWNTLVDARGVDNAVTPTELKNAFTSRPSLAQTLADMPRQTYEAVHGPLLDAQMGAKGAPWTVAAFLAGAASLFGGFFLIQWLTSVAVGLMIAGALNILAGVIGSVALPRWNADKLLNAKRWAAYRNFLTDFSAMNTAPAEHLKLWDYHFVYASALGVAQSYLHNVKRLAEAHPDYYFTPTWIGYYAAGNLGAATGAAGVADSLTALNSLSSIATNLTQLENSLNPSSNSSGGGFGGGSFGGSGGGGSSSAG